MMRHISMIEFARLDGTDEVAISGHVKHARVGQRIERDAVSYVVESTTTMIVGRDLRHGGKRIPHRHRCLLEMIVAREQARAQPTTTTTKNEGRTDEHQ